MKVDALILAAGKGTRMKSEIPKVLHRIGNKTLIEILIDKIMDMVDRVIVVVGYRGDEVRKYLSQKYNSLIFVEQKEQLGTAHAVKVALDKLQGDVTIIIPGDAPFVSKDTIRMMLDSLKDGDMVTLLMEVEAPEGYGRAITDGERLLRIVEESDLTDSERDITLVNTGVYAVKSDILKNFIGCIEVNPKKGEYYLTDIIEILNKNGKKVKFIVCKEEEGMGINDRFQLVKAFRSINSKKIEELIKNGVTVISPENTFIDEEVEIEPDTIIWPYVFIQGKTRIGKRCEIMPFVVIRDSIIKDDCKIREYSHIEGAIIEEEVNIGPFARIRPETIIKARAKIGNFVELKKTIMGERSQANHLAYLGDATIGSGVNIGAGVITCNYDGVRKNPTFIDDGAFIGSDCQLVAPVRIGKNALIGAGTTVTKNIPDDALAVSRAELRILEGKGMNYYRKRKGEGK